MKIDLEWQINEEAYNKIIRDSLETAAQMMVERAVQNLDTAGIKRQTGALVSSIGYSETENGFVVCAGTQGQVDYALYLEYGTGLYGPKHRAYEVRPVKAKALHWVEEGTTTGPRGGERKFKEHHFAKKVVIKGIRPVHFFRSAYEEVMVELPKIIKFNIEREMK